MSEKDPFGRDIDTYPPKVVTEAEARVLMARYAEEEAAQDAALGDPTVGDDVGEIGDLDDLEAVLATDASGNQVEEEGGEWVAYLDGRRFGGFPNRAAAAAWLEHFGPRRS